MPTTPKLALRYPAATDAPDGPGALLNLALDVEGAVQPGWTPYNPTTGSFGFTVPGGTGFYRYSGGRITVKFRGVFSAANAGSLFVSLPKPADASGSTRVLPVGRALVTHGGNAYEFGLDITSDTFNVSFTYPGGTLGLLYYVTNTAPFGWAAGDTLTTTFTYDPA